MSSFVDKVMESIVGRGPSERFHRAQLAKLAAKNRERLNKETPMSEELQSCIKDDGGFSSPRPSIAPIRTCSTFERPTTGIFTPKMHKRMEAKRRQAEAEEAEALRRPTSEDNLQALAAAELLSERMKRIYSTSPTWDPRSGDVPPLGPMKGMGRFRRSTKCDSEAELERFRDEFMQLASMGIPANDIVSERIIDLLPSTKSRLSFSSNASSTSGTTGEYSVRAYYDSPIDSPDRKTIYVQQNGFPASAPTSRPPSRTGSVRLKARDAKNVSAISLTSLNDQDSPPASLFHTRSPPEYMLTKLGSVAENETVQQADSPPRPLKFQGPSSVDDVAIEDSSWEDEKDAKVEQLHVQGQRRRAKQGSNGNELAVHDRVQPSQVGFGRNVTAIKWHEKVTSKNKTVVEKCGERRTSAPSKLKDTKAVVNEAQKLDTDDGDDWTDVLESLKEHQNPQPRPHGSDDVKFVSQCTTLVGDEHAAEHPQGHHKDTMSALSSATTCASNEDQPQTETSQHRALQRSLSHNLPQYSSGNLPKKPRGKSASRGPRASSHLRYQEDLVTGELSQ